MTEEEAKTKWCPFARVVGCDERRDSYIGNRLIRVEEARAATKTVPSHDHALCLASACMAWRSPRDQTVTRTQRESPGEGWRKTRQEDFDRLPEWSRDLPAAERIGSCGLAGAVSW